MQSLKQPVFIFGSHKSGSSLLRSLLDGHPELFVIPSESHFFQLTGHCVDFRMRKAEPRSLSVEQKSKNLNKYIHQENISDDPHGAVMVENRYDETLFGNFLAQQNISNEQDLMTAYLKAFHNALKGSDLPEGTRVVEKSVEHAEFAPLIKKWYPDAKFIHIVRNPYATLVASRNTNWQKGYPYLGIYLESLRNSYCQLFKNLNLFEDYHVLRYEDLVNDPQAVMQSIAEFIDIEMDEILLRPTLVGEPWTGNSSSNKKFTGVSSSPSSKWLDSICDIEILLANRVARAVLEHFNYEILSPRHHPLKQKFMPIRGETLSRYLRNRSLLWSL